MVSVVIASHDSTEQFSGWIYAKNVAMASNRSCIMAPICCQVAKLRNFYVETNEILVVLLVYAISVHQTKWLRWRKSTKFQNYWIKFHWWQFNVWAMVWNRVCHYSISCCFSFLHPFWQFRCGIFLSCTRKPNTHTHKHIHHNWNNIFEVKFEQTSQTGCTNAVHVLYLSTLEYDDKHMRRRGSTGAQPRQWWYRSYYLHYYTMRHWRRDTGVWICDFTNLINLYIQFSCVHVVCVCALDTCLLTICSTIELGRCLRYCRTCEWVRVCARACVCLQRDNRLIMSTRNEMDAL